MKRLLIAVVPLLVAVCCADEPAKPSVPLQPSQLAPLISKELPAGWRCISDLDSIVILRDEPVTLMNLTNTGGHFAGDPVGPMEHGWESPYMIVLQFRPKLSDDDYAKLVAMRAAVKESKNRKSDSPLKFAIPDFFTDEYSICLHRSDGINMAGDLTVVSESDAKECSDVLATVVKFFKPYPKLDGDSDFLTTRPAQ